MKVFFSCSQSGLIMACYHGYVDVVMALAQCPYIDVNWQDNEGNTALITAAQAGEKTAKLLHCCWLASVARKANRTLVGANICICRPM